MEERQAIQRLRRGDIGGLEFLVVCYQVRAVRAAWLVTHDAALAQDLVQAAFVKAYERIAQFDPERPFGPWFLTAVLHDAVKSAQERDRYASLDGLAEDAAGPADFRLADERPGPELLGE